MVTAETLPVGLLDQITAALHTSRSHVGLLMGWYALVAATTPVPLTRLTARLDRRLLIAGTLLVFAGAGVAGALAPSLPALFAARGISAAAHALFFAVAAPALLRLAPPERKARAAGLVAVGATSAFVVGVPLTTAFGQIAGWRAALGVTAAVGALLAVACLRVLPRMPQPRGAAAERAAVLPVLRSRSLLSVLAVTMLLVVAHFDVFTFLSPLLAGEAGVRPAGLSVLLGVYGCAAVAGSAVGGRLAESRPCGSVLVGVPMLVVAFLALAVGGVVTVLAVLLWGAVFALLGVLTQLAVLRIAGHGPAAETASALHGSTFQTGIAAGSGVSSVLVGAGLLGALPLVSAAVAVTALAALVMARSAFACR
jgi:predicted MFS family arabinose efflux permease